MKESPLFSLASRFRVAAGNVNMVDILYLQHGAVKGVHNLLQI